MKIKLSIVMASSNSNFGGKVYREIEPAVPTPEEKRLELSLFTLHEAFKNIDYEVVFVEWNRLKDRKPYREYDFMKHPRIRIIEVSEEFSHRVHKGLQFHEMWAKNVGIRRAYLSSEYILGTNIDILWLHEMESIINQNLITPMIAWRWTVYHNVLQLGKDLVALNNYCLQDKNRIDHDLNSNGDFTLLSSEQWAQLKGYSITYPGWAGSDMWMIQRAAAMTGKLKHLPFPIFHIRHPGAPLESGYGQTNISDDWGAPQEEFPEWVNGEQIK